MYTTAKCNKKCFHQFEEFKPKYMKRGKKYGCCVAVQRDSYKFPNHLSLILNHFSHSQHLLRVCCLLLLLLLMVYVSVVVYLFCVFSVVLACPLQL